MRLLLLLIIVFLPVPGARPQGASSSAASGTAAANRTSAAITPSVKPEPKKARESYKRGLKAEQAGDWGVAHGAYSDAVDRAPNEHEYLLRRQVATSHLVQAKVDLAEREAISGRLKDARKELIDASYLDPTNMTVRERLTELSALDSGTMQEPSAETEIGGEVHLNNQPGTKNFDFRGDTQSAYDEVARQFGVEVAFDIDLPPRSVRFQFTDVDFPTAMRLLGDITGTFWRPFTSRLFFVAEATPQKRKDYDVSVVRTVLLPGSETADQMTETLRLVRDITGITRANLDTNSRTITLRASPQAIAVATSLIDDLDKPTGELILEMEVLEVNRTAAHQFGITPPQGAHVYTFSTQEIQEAEQSYAGLIDVIDQVFGTSSIPPVVAFGGGTSTFLAELPGAAANFSELLSLVRHGRRILLRAQDGQPATFFVGDRYPMSLSSYSASLVAASGSTSTLISPITNYAAGNSPSFVATTSLRDDGFNDLIVANSAGNTISVLLGDGQGVLATQVTYPTGTDPVWIATGQFNTSSTASNSDNFIDLAVANKGANTLSVLLGNGDGTFKPKTDIATGATPVSVVAADFHDLAGNGFIDLAVANQGDSTISIFQGNGDGTFKTPTLIKLPAGFEPSALAAVDLNNDGHIDLVVADTDNNTISVLLGNGNGTFQSRTDYATGNNPVYVAFGDFNGDGALDIAVANNGATTSANSGNTVTIYYNEKSSASVPLGKFVAGATRDFASGNGPTSIAVADFNLDGSVDLAVSDETDNAVTVLLNTGNESFTALSELSVGTAPVSIVSADFNADGRPDAATADSGAAEATVILNSTSLFGSGTNAAGSAFPGVQYLDVGLKVKATPRIHLNDEVTLQLQFDISSLSGQSINSIPVVSNDTISQTVRVKQNETAVVAGILQGQASNAINGTPGIGAIPEIGLFAGDQNVQDTDNELLILVTPRMVRYPARRNRFIYAGQGALDGPGNGPAEPPLPPQSGQGPPPPPPGQPPPAGAPPAAPGQEQPGESQSQPTTQPGTPAGRPQQPSQPPPGQPPPSTGPQDQSAAQPPSQQPPQQ